LTKGNYVDLLEAERYFTATPGRRVQRHRIINNLLGGRDFCLVIRKTEKLAAMEKIDLRERCEAVAAAFGEKEGITF